MARYHPISNHSGIYEGSTSELANNRCYLVLWILLHICRKACRVAEKERKRAQASWEEAPKSSIKEWTIWFRSENLKKLLVAWLSTVWWRWNMPERFWLQFKNPAMYWYCYDMDLQISDHHLLNGLENELQPFKTTYLSKDWFNCNSQCLDTLMRHVVVISWSWMAWVNIEHLLPYLSSAINFAGHYLSIWAFFKLHLMAGHLISRKRGPRAPDRCSAWQIVTDSSAQEWRRNWYEPWFHIKFLHSLKINIT